MSLARHPSPVNSVLLVSRECHIDMPLCFNSINYNYIDQQKRIMIIDSLCGGGASIPTTPVGSGRNV